MGSPDDETWLNDLLLSTGVGLPSAPVVVADGSDVPDSLEESPPSGPLSDGG